MKTKRQVLSAVVGTLVILAWTAGLDAPAAWAQNESVAEEQIESGVQETEEPETVEDTVVSDTVVVTATYRETPLMDTPLAITEVSAAALVELGAVNNETLHLVVPGLSYKTNSGATWNRLTVRGLSPPAESADLSPTVAVYQDNASVTSGGGALRQLAGSLFDLERVEVLKGPQGTLYGEAAMGGAIRYITAKPSLSGLDYRFTAAAGEAEGGSGMRRIDGMINIPLGERIGALRIVAFDRDDGGFYDTPTLGLVNYNDVRDRGGRAMLAFFPTDSTSLRLAGYMVDTESDGPSLADGGPYINATLDDPDLFNFGNDETELYTFQLDHVFSKMQIELSSSFLNREVVFTEQTNERFVLLVDDTFQLLTSILLPGLLPPGRIFESLGGVYAGPTDRNTQELRLLSTTGGRLRWTAGAYYGDDVTQDGQWNRELSGTDTEAQRKYTPEKEPFAPLLDGLINQLFGPDIERETEELAAFGEVGYDLSDTFELVAGVRVSRLTKTFDVTGGAQPGSGEWKGTKVSPKITAVWRPQSRSMYYATIGTGYRPGGFNTSLVSTIATLRTLGLTGEANTLESLLEFDGDEIVNYEIGAKVFPAPRTSLAVALYYMDWKNTLVEDDYFGVLGRSVYLTDSGKARSTGVEVELSSQVTDRLRISFGGDFNDAVNQALITTTLGGTTPAPPGNKLANAPEYSFDLRLFYDVDLPGEWSGRVVAGYSGVDDSFNRVTNEIKTDGYEVANLRFGVRAPSGRWGLALVANNITNEAFAYECNEVGCRYGVPRYIGLELSLSR